MRFSDIKIGRKILLAFSILIAVLVGNGIYTAVILDQSIQAVDTIEQEIDPSLTVLRDFNDIVKDSRTFTTNWVYVPKNKADKEALWDLHKNRYPAFKEQLGLLVAGQSSGIDTAKINSVMADFEALMAIEAEIMKSLVSSDDYNDILLKLDAEETIEDEVIPRSAEIDLALDAVIASTAEISDAYKDSMRSSFTNLSFMVIVLAILALVLGVLCSVFLSRFLTRAILRLKLVIDQLREGSIPKQISNPSKDEIGQMEEAVNALIGGLNSYAHFAEEVGTGSLDTEFTKLGDSDKLGNSLIEMRNNLVKVRKEETQRNWSIEGLASFAEILRTNNDSIQTLSNQIISHVVKYTGSNQGALYLLGNEENSQTLEMTACYAWGRTKFTENKIAVGDGLVGQCYLEGQTIFLTDVPQDFVKITSGLGESTPRCVILVPLRTNEEVLGILEIASFDVFESHQIEFLEKLAENIASTISAVRVNEHTKRLLDESRVLAEQFQAQEEELRQNHEEMMATQEENSRVIQQLENELDTLRKAEQNVQTMN